MNKGLQKKKKIYFFLDSFFFLQRDNQIWILGFFEQNTNPRLSSGWN